MASRTPTTESDQFDSSEASSVGDTTTKPVLLYDAHCEICNELAYKVRAYAKKPIRLVALSDPEADEILGEQYADGWEKDFYLVDGDACRKGARAFPKLVRLVGVRKFGSLAADYAEYKRHSDDCGHDDHESGSGLSRRSFTGAMSAAALPIAGPIKRMADPSSDAPFDARPPRGLKARVARIRPDGTGGFDVDVELDMDLVRDRSWQGDDGVTAKQKPAEMESAGATQLVDTDSRTISRASVDVTARAADSDLEAAIDMSGESMTRFGLLEDQDRHGISLNLGTGPMVVDDEPAVGTTMSGKISHDVAEKTVDFLKLETEGPVDVATHLDGYVAGMQALEDHYSAKGNGKMATLYARLAADMRRASDDFADEVDDDLLPATNEVGISSVPYWTRYVESPTASTSSHQDVNVQGTDCSCGCCGISCCSDCGCGCSICLGTEPGCGCGCCIIGCGGGCGCGCCICA